MHDVILLSTLLSKVGRLRRPRAAASQEQHLRPAAGLQPPLPFHPSHHAMLSPVPATSTAPTLAK